MFDDEMEDIPMLKGMVVKAYNRGDKLKLPLKNYAFINFDEEVVEGGFYYDTNYKWVGIASENIVKNIKNGYGDKSLVCVIILPSPELTKKLSKYREGTVLFTELTKDKDGDYVVKKPYSFHVY